MSLAGSDFAEPSPLNTRSSSGLLASYNYKTDFLFASLRQPSALLHEALHFYDHISSPYGLFLDHITELQLTIYSTLIELFSAEDAPPIPVPLRSLLGSSQFDRLYDYLKANSGPRFALDRCAAQLTVISVLWPRLLLLERVMEGVASSAVSEASTPDVLQALRTFEFFNVEHEGAITDSLDSLLEFLDSYRDRAWLGPERPLSPMPPLLGKQLPGYLGAIAILEAKTITVEHATTYRRGRKDPLLQALAASQHDYYGALGVLEALPDVLTYPGKVLFETFAILADLAMYLPIGRLYRQFRAKADYTDLHPGWRLLKLCAALKEIGPFDRSKEIHPFDYQESFCAKLDWASPRAFLAAGAALDNPNSYHEARHAKACQLKLTAPRLFFPACEFLGDLTPDHLAPDLMPLWLDPRSRNGGTSDDGSLVFYFRAVRAYLVSLGWSIFVTGRPTRDIHLPRGFPYDRYCDFPGTKSIRALIEKQLRGQIKFDLVC